MRHEKEEKREEKLERHEHMGGKHHSKNHGMGKKEVGFGAHLGKMGGKKSSLEGPHK